MTSLEVTLPLYLCISIYSSTTARTKNPLRDNLFLILTGMSYIAGMFLMNMNEEVGSSACVLR